MLGPTYDYVHRLLNFSLTEEKEEELQQWRAALRRKSCAGRRGSLFPTRLPGCWTCSGRRAVGAGPEDRSEPCDVTMENLPLPAPRSAILQTLTRADTGFVSALLTAISAVSACPTPPLGNSGTGARIEVDYPLEGGGCLVRG